MLGQVGDSARGLVDSLSDIVWSLDPRRDDLGQVVVRVREFASDLLGQSGIALSFRAPETADQVRLPAAHRRHLYLVLKEAIHNVVKHSGAACVAMSLSLERGALVANRRRRGSDGGAPGPRNAY